ncbi:MAG: L,D-transpeptidase family protein [Nitrospirae bacterium]|nr:L,D-transpeptidase family protein [Nitrospirota bacterium]
MKMIFLIRRLLSAAFVASLLLSCTGAMASQQKVEQVLSGNIFSDTDKKFTAIVVDKHRETLYVVEVQDNVPVVTRSFRIIAGKNEGDKVKEGDNKTPEGIYFIKGSISPGKLNSILFGDGAYTLNYPNIVDKNRGKTGHGIWIHGRGKDRNDDRTKGCVSLNNNDLEALKTYISIDTPVVISRSLEYLKSEEYKKKKRKYSEYFKGFITAWEKGDFEDFANYFDNRFREVGGLPNRAYLQKKKKLMRKYSERKVVASDVVIFTENSTEMLYKFNQLYCANNVLSFGVKKLYLTADKSDDYKIIAEEFEKGDPGPYVRQQVEAFLSKWKNNWRARDLEKYAGFYSTDFYSDNMNLKQWKAHKKSHFSSARNIKLEISDLSVTIVSPMMLRVAFKQHYSSGAVSDTGLKTMVLTGCPGSYKIKEEHWQAL